MATVKRDPSDTLNPAPGIDKFPYAGETYNGGPGNNVHYGTRGDDLLIGNGGHDLLVGNGGDDVIDGGTGDDTLVGGDGDDVLLGGAGENTMDGGNGNDWIAGGADDEDIDGGSGNDTLSGGGGSDEIDGGAGDDIIRGGRNPDWLTGGTGADTFLYLASDIDFAAVGDDARDHILDFESGVDTVDLSALASLTPNGSLFFDDADGIAGEAGEIMVYDFAGNGVMTLDLDGDGSMDFVLYFLDVVPQESDFTLA